MTYNEQLKHKKEILEEILDECKKYGIKDESTMAIIEGKLQAIYQILGEEK